jgi:hypothetical protein
MLYRPRTNIRDRPFTKLSSSLEKDKFSAKIKSILLKKLRVYFFFIDSIESLQNFLENTEVEFRITDGPHWNKPLAFASAYPFTHF